jgi:thiamine kinase-like enzyme
VGDLDDILRQLEPSLGPVGGAPAPLEGGITNRNFRVRFARGEYVVRLHGKDTDLLGISREAELLANERAASLGIAPEVACGFEGGLVTRFLTCEALGPQEIAEGVQEIAGALRAFHESGIRLPVTFDIPALLAEYAENMRARGTEPPAGYLEISHVAARIVATIPAAELCPCHNDLLAGNLIRSRSGGRVMIVDWEYAGMGDPYFDLGNLAVNNGFDATTEAVLLEAYHLAPPTSAQTARLQLMRILSDARESAWGVMQGVVSELDFDFEAYAGEHLGRLRDAVSGPFERLLVEAGG